MSKRVSKAASQELAFLAALESIHADVDISKIAEIQDWSRAVRGKLYGASIKGTLHFSPSQASVSPAIVTNAPSSSRVALTSGNVASHGSVQYSQMEIPQLIAECTSESSEEAWSEFVRRSQPLIAGVITKIVHRSGSVSSEIVHDLSQEVYLRLCSNNFRALRNFKTHHENALFGILKVIAANTAMDYFRSAASERGAGKALKDDRFSPEFVSSRGVSAEPERKMFLEEIDRALKTLSHQPDFERSYAIFWLYYRNGLTAEEISALPDVKLTVKGVESILHQLKRHLRDALLRDKKNS